jgi:hypothetical protein
MEFNSDITVWTGFEYGIQASMQGFEILAIFTQPNVINLNIAIRCIVTHARESLVGFEIL